MPIMFNSLATLSREWGKFHPHHNHVYLHSLIPYFIVAAIFIHIIHQPHAKSFPRECFNGIATLEHRKAMLFTWGKPYGTTVFASILGGPPPRSKTMEMQGKDVQWYLHNKFIWYVYIYINCCSSIEMTQQNLPIFSSFRVILEIRYTDPSWATKPPRGPKSKHPISVMDFTWPKNSERGNFAQNDWRLDEIMGDWLPPKKNADDASRGWKSSVLNLLSIQMPTLRFPSPKGFHLSLGHQEALLGWAGLGGWLNFCSGRLSLEVKSFSGERFTKSFFLGGGFE